MVNARFPCSNHRNEVRRPELQLVGIGTQTSFAIGQRALLVQSDDGFVQWNCVSLLDETTIAVVKALGGIRAIAISHPHWN